MTAFLAAFAGPLLAFAAYCLLAYLVCLAVVPGHRASLTRKVRKAGHLLAEAGPWLVSTALHPWAMRGRRMPPMDPRHPAVIAREAREFEDLELMYWDRPAVTDDDRLTPRRPS